MHIAVPTLDCPQCAAQISLAEQGPWLDSRLRCEACGWAPERQDNLPLLAPALAQQGSDFDPKAFDMLAAIEPWHFWFGPRARLLSTLVDRHFPDAATFMEIGCGTGFITGAVARLKRWTRIMGGEVSAHGLTHAARLLPPQVQLLQLDARNMPFQSAIDVIGCFDVLEHITEDQEVLNGFVRALRPGGGVVLAVPQHMWLWSGADTFAEHKRRYAQGELEAKCAAAGLEVVASMSYATLTLPLLLASRRASSNVSDAQGAPTELTPPRWINAVLRAALQVEVSLTLLGLHWPVGGSRIVVARRPANGQALPAHGSGAVESPLSETSRG